MSLDLLHPRDLSDPELLLWSLDLKEFALEFMELRMLLDPLDFPEPESSSLCLPLSLNDDPSR